ncbi:MAG: permease, partial [Pseudomonadota bacterium]
MSDENATEEKRNLPIMTGQSTFAQAAWTMASPSIVLTFLAVSLELPVFLIGALVSIRQFGGTLADIFLFDPVSRIQKRKHTLALTGLLIAACFVLAIIASLFGSKSVIVVVFVLVIFI